MSCAQPGVSGHKTAAQVLKPRLWGLYQGLGQVRLNSDSVIRNEHVFMCVLQVGDPGQSLALGLRTWLSKSKCC